MKRARPDTFSIPKTPRQSSSPCKINQHRKHIQYSWEASEWCVLDRVLQLNYHFEVKFCGQIQLKGRRVLFHANFRKFCMRKKVRHCEVRNERGWKGSAENHLGSSFMGEMVLTDKGLIFLVFHALSGVSTHQSQMGNLRCARTSGNSQKKIHRWHVKIEFFFRSRAKVDCSPYSIESTASIFVMQWRRWRWKSKFSNNFNLKEKSTFSPREKKNHSNSINYKLFIHDDVPANCFYLCCWSCGKHGVPITTKKLDTAAIHPCSRFFLKTSEKSKKVWEPKIPWKIRGAVRNIYQLFNKKIAFMREEGKLKNWFSARWGFPQTPSTIFSRLEAAHSFDIYDCNFVCRTWMRAQ